MMISILQLLFRVKTEGLKQRHILQDIVVDGFIEVVDVRTSFEMDG
jgi:hypothetical protein